jgi:hypothetical protein
MSNTAIPAQAWGLRRESYKTLLPLASRRLPFWPGHLL